MSIVTRRLACLPYTALFRAASCRSISHTNALAANKNQGALSETKQRSSLPSTSVAKAKEAAKDVSYGFVIVGGVLVTGAIFYVIFKELFSSNSPNGVYSSAQKKCLNDGRVCAVLGEPIKTFGEETSRGRRRHTSLNG